MRLIPLVGKYAVGKFAKVSDEDYEFLSALRWHVSDKGYAKTYYQGKHRSMHQLIIGSYCDHRNRDRLDNTRENLRLATFSQNNANVKARAKSGFKGVVKDSTCDSWRAMISVKGKMVHLGSFKTKERAALVYDLWAVVLHGSFAETNFPIVSGITKKS
jgi:hypothetical protein